MSNGKFSNQNDYLNPNNPNETVVCPHCKERYSKNKTFCPYCNKDVNGNAHGYTPMSEKTVRTVKIVLGSVLLVAFIVIYVLVLNK